MKKLLRFSLLKLIIVITVIAVFMGVYGERRYRARIHEQAVAELRIGAELAGRKSLRVVYDYEIPDFRKYGPYNISNNPNEVPTPHPWSEKYGVDFFHSPKLVVFLEPPEVEKLEPLQRLSTLEELVFLQDADEEVLRRLSNCDQVEKLVFYQAGLESRCDFKELVGMSGLNSLEFKTSWLTDESFHGINQADGIYHLEMRQVFLEHCDVEKVPILENIETLVWIDVTLPMDLRLLTRLPNLRQLELEGYFEVDKFLLDRIGQMEDLEALVIDREARSTIEYGKLKQMSNPFAEQDPMSGEGSGGASVEILAGIGELQRLSRIELRRVELNDRDFTILEQLKSLKHLSILDSVVSDSGVAKLENSRSLKTVSFKGSLVAKEAIAKLAQKRPRLEIVVE